MARLYVGKHEIIVPGNKSILSAINSQICLNEEEVYVTNNGRIVPKDSLLKDGETYHIVPRVLGGKGGFGSMLRALGAQIEKTTNREACRDLRGRRMRDVNQEQQLRDWVAKKAERETLRAEKRRERAEKRRHVLEGGSHKFVDDDYHSQKMKVLEQLDQALQQGLNQVASSSSASASAASSSSETSKRKAGDSASKHRGPSAKKTCEWLGIDIEDLSDSDKSENSSGSDSEDSGATSGSELILLQQTLAALQQTSQHEQDEAAAVSPQKDKDSPDDKKEAPTSLFDHTDGNKKTESSAEDVKEDEQKLENGKEVKHGLLATLAEIPPQSDKKTNEKEENSKTEAETGPLDLESFKSTEELEALGLERLKNALISLALKCGGTLQQRAERLWSVRGVPVDKIDPKLLAKPMKGKKK